MTPRRITLVLLACSFISVQAWNRTRCGFIGGKSDIITSWGRTVSPSTPVLAEYPRPMLVRGDASQWMNLNGLWQYQFGDGTEPIPYNTDLSSEILVPFCPESCLSGVGRTPPKYFSWYRLVFDVKVTAPKYKLHFGAVDWQADVYFNGQFLGNHTGGYDGFGFEVTPTATNNELIVRAFDPSDSGAQPNGKQFVGRIIKPGGDTYTPTSGIWQTVWLEALPAFYIVHHKVTSDAPSGSFTLALDTNYNSTATTLNVVVSKSGTTVISAKGVVGQPLTVAVPNAQLWAPGQPNLYDLAITACDTSVSPAVCDSVTSYVGIRSITLGSTPIKPIPPTGPQPGVDRPGNDLPGSPFTLAAADPNLCWGFCNASSACQAWAYDVPNCGGDPAVPQCWLKSANGGGTDNKCRVSGAQGQDGTVGLMPLINGQPVFFAGWLDQGWWPDGEYTAPTDDALRSDLQAVLDFGLNTIRMHQKVNSERWYYYADTLGIALMQDAVQKYGGASPDTVAPFLHDLQAMIDGRGNHPCIVQWETFNEGDCYGVFNVSDVVAWTQAYDPLRLVDTDSGGGANDLHIGNVNDLHTYPYPGDAKPSATQYAMLGEYGGVGWFTPDPNVWAPGQCGAYLNQATPQDYVDTYVAMTKTIVSQRADLSAVIYTQITDVENECDGMLNMDRTPKFNAAQMAQLIAANQAMVNSATARETLTVRPLRV